MRVCFGLLNVSGILFKRLGSRSLMKKNKRCRRARLGLFFNQSSNNMFQHKPCFAIILRCFCCCVILNAMEAFRDEWQKKSM